MRVAVLLLPVILAGCLGAPVPSPLSATDTQPVPDAEDAAVAVQTTPSRKTYEWQAANLTFENALQQYRIVADGNATIELTWETRLGRYAEREECLVLAAFHSVEEKGATAIQWAYKLAYQAELEAMGEPHDVRLLSYQGGLSAGSVAEARWNLTRGDALVLLVGGRSHEYLQWPVLDSSSQAVPPMFDLLVNATGPTHLEHLADLPLRCGVGPEQAQAMAQATTFGSGLTALAALSMETKNATSLLVTGVVGFDTPREGAAIFGDERIPLGAEIKRSERGPGRVGLEFDVWVDVLASTPAWLLADADLPFLRWKSG